jgi:hypothetical protein
MLNPFFIMATHNVFGVLSASWSKVDWWLFWSDRVLTYHFNLWFDAHFYSLFWTLVKGDPLFLVYVSNYHLINLFSEEKQFSYKMDDMIPFINFNQPRCFFECRIRSLIWAIEKTAWEKISCNSICFQDK